MAYSNQRNKADDDQRKSTATKKLRFLNNSNKGRKVDDDQSHNWGEILPEILQLVQSKLRFVDIVRSKSVCSWWNVGLKLPLVPWLLLPQSYESDEEEEEEEAERCSYILRTFFRLGDHNYYDIKNMNPGKCIGSSCGLVVWEKEELDHHYPVGEASILDPLSLAQIKLPLFPTSNPHLEWPDIKIVLSSGNPRDGVAIIMCLDRQPTKLFFCKIGDTRWHKLDGQFKEYFDIICHDNFLYALSYEDSIEVWDLSKSYPVKCKIIEPSRSIIETNLASDFDDLYFFQKYLVQSCGNLLLVVRMVGHFVDARGKAVYRILDSNNPSIQPYRTLMFHVYKLDSSEENWVEAEDLNNEVLFLGGNHSVSVSAKDLPPGCGTNVIYFTDDNLVLLEHIDNYGGHDLGMFSLQNKIVKHFSNKCRSKRIWPPPLWIVPNPMRN